MQGVMKKMLLLMCVGILFSTSCQARCSKKRPTPTVQTGTTKVATETPTETATVPTETTTVPTVTMTVPTETTTVPTEPPTFPTDTTTVPTEAPTTPQPEATAAPKCDCGRHNNASARLFGGAATHPHEYPSFAAFVPRDKRMDVLCGGSVIADQWVLTSRSCEFGSSALIVLGGHNLTAEEPSRKYFEIESYTYYEDWRIGLMLVKLKEKIEFTDEVSPICLPSKSFTDETNNNFGTVVGYGKSKQILIKDNLQLESAWKCKQAGGFYESLVKDFHICTPTPGRVSCPSDNGAPLLVERNGRLTQVAINYYAAYVDGGCADASLPVVYTKTGSFVEWMERKMGAEVCLN